MIDIWNVLPGEALESDTGTIFKRHLDVNWQGIEEYRPCEMLENGWQLVLVGKMIGMDL